MNEKERIYNLSPSALPKKIVLELRNDNKNYDCKMYTTAFDGEIEKNVIIKMIAEPDFLTFSAVPDVSEQNVLWNLIIEDAER